MPLLEMAINLAMLNFITPQITREIACFVKNTHHMSL